MSFAIVGQGIPNYSQENKYYGYYPWLPFRIESNPTFLKTPHTHDTVLWCLKFDLIWKRPSWTLAYMIAENTMWVAKERKTVFLPNLTSMNHKIFWHRKISVMIYWMTFTCWWWPTLSNWTYVILSKKENIHDIET